jgi:aminoglycoside phosphotransferase (APT) family kinase protein
MVQERPGSASADPAVCSDLPEILWRRGGRGGHDDHVPRPQAQPGQLGVEVVAWLARQACGERAVSCRRNQDSRDREVHDVVTASGARLVIRGEAEESIGLDQEAWFLAQARQAGVPAPEVLWLGTVDTPTDARTVMVQTAAEGVALAGILPGMFAGQRRSAAASLGATIARLHSVGVGGFYRRHADGRFDYAELAALQAADLADRVDDLRVLAEAGLTSAQVCRAEDLLPEAVAARGGGPAALCHCDLRPDHVFVTTGENAAVIVAGLIDFGDAAGGRPLDDVAMLCRNWPDMDRAALAAGYGPAAFWDDHGRRLALGQLRLLIGFAAYDLRTGQPALAQRDLADLQAVLTSPALA